MMRFSVGFAAALALPLAIAAPARAQDAPPPADLPQAVQPAPSAQPAPTPPPAAVPSAQPMPAYGQAYGQPPYPPPMPYYGPPPGYAQPMVAAPRAPDVERSIPGNWYGWQTLIAVAPFDIAMFTGLAKFGQQGYTEVFAAGFAGRNLAPAVVHWAHGRVATGFGSIGLHAGATATGVAIGYAIGLAATSSCTQRVGCDNNLRDLPPGPGYGAIAGSMVGTVLDVIFFAHRQRLSWTASAPAPRATTAWALAPYATGKSAGVAAAGTF